jgi:hypothetical protein
MSNLYKDPEDFDLDEEDFEDEEVVSYTQKESIQNMLENILSGNLVESSQSFTNIITAKIAARLEESKINVAKGVFGLQESHDNDEDDKNSEVDDDSFSKSIHGQLKTAEDMDDNKIQDDEKENPEDGRVKAKLAARAAKGQVPDENENWHRNIQLKQGSVTLQDGDAKKINNFLAGLKPTKRDEVSNHMHQSPKHFNAVHDVVKKFQM